MFPQSALQIGVAQSSFYVKAIRVRLVDGVVAQLVERLVRNEKVAGSIPVGSTIPNLSDHLEFPFCCCRFYSKDCRRFFPVEFSFFVPLLGGGDSLNSSQKDSRHFANSIRFFTPGGFTTKAFAPSS